MEKIMLDVRKPESNGHWSQRIVGIAAGVLFILFFLAMFFLS